ncbi:glutamate--tRNA ligase [Seleniivibrio sp.]|uniref:glutamate--tRNA ligase n=1 Tax=Seleniivibrio sp. TaxID=2898801 RepID=UPI0025F9AB85|nr:glutamate--tRNA ligase [Seleniivibrio sp.]MCD8554873.1 glutamate--tRNA ligase [Seleniivibrio sp.]
MSENRIRVRFAPSPTGYLHVGGARTALFNYLFAKKTGGTFLLRIEDTDRTRFQEDSLKEIFESLKWMGIEWTEGPEKGGDFGPYIQSERLDIYKKYAQILWDRGQVYPCFCTPERLEKMRKEKELRKEIHGGYDRRCRDISKEEAMKRIEVGEPYVLRLKAPLEGSISFIDGIRGEIETPVTMVDDTVLMKTDGYPTYHLASVVDDHLMEISHVLRGDEWIASTPRHILLYKAFGWQPPVIAHLPVILSPDGGKLSKRKGAASVMDYKRAGFLPEALLNFLSLLGWNPGDDREIMSVNEIMEAFDMHRISAKPSVFDEQKLEWMNGQYMEHYDSAKLLADIEPMWAEKGLPVADFSAEYKERVVSLFKTRCKKVTEFGENGGYFFKDPEEYDAKQAGKQFTAAVKPALDKIVEKTDSVADWNRAALEELFHGIADELGMSAGKINPAVRLAVTGVGGGPDLFDMLELLGKDCVKRRVAAASAWIEKNV